VGNDFASRSKTFQKQAVDFQNKDVLPWYDDVATLDAATVRTRGNRINVGWESLVAQHASLAKEGARAKAELAETPAPEETAAPRPTIGSIETELVGAGSALEHARKQIGLVVGLQDYRGKPMLRGYRAVPTGPDPTVFVDTQVERAQHAFSIILRAGAICEHELGQFTVAEEDKLVAVISETTNELEYKFVMAALTHLGYAAAVYRIHDDPKAQLVAHHDRLQELDAATRDGDIDTKLAQQMSEDMRRLVVEAETSGGASSVNIDEILDRYAKPPEAKRVFVRLIERRGIGDALMRRGNTERVSTFLGRAYDAEGDTRRGIGAAAADIGDEAARQAPGAVLTFMAGVYGGMSSLPGIGGVMQDASDGFKDLAKLADEATGAWQDGAVTRNTIAWWTGYSVEKIAEMAVTRDLAGARGAAALHGATTTAEAIDMFGVCEGLVHQAREVYESASDAWKLAIEQLPMIMRTVRDGVALAHDGEDIAFDLGIQLAGAAFDTGVDALAKLCKTKLTAEGRVAKNAAKQPEEHQGKRPADGDLDADVRDAAQRLRDAHKRVAHAPTSVERWHAGYEAKRAAEDLREILGSRERRRQLGEQQLGAEQAQEERRKQNVHLERGGLPGEIGDRFVTIFITAGTKLVKKLETIFLDEVKHARVRDRDGKRRGLDAAKLKERMIEEGAGTAAAAIVESTAGELGKYVAGKLAGVLAGLVEHEYPGTRTLAVAALKPPLEQLADYVTGDVVADWLKERVTEAVHDLIEQGDE